MLFSLGLFLGSLSGLDCFEAGLKAELFSPIHPVALWQQDASAPCLVFAVFVPPSSSSSVCAHVRAFAAGGMPASSTAARATENRAPCCEWQLARGEDLGSLVFESQVPLIHRVPATPPSGSTVDSSTSHVPLRSRATAQLNRHAALCRTMAHRGTGGHKHSSRRTSARRQHGSRRTSVLA